MNGTTADPRGAPAKGALLTIFLTVLIDTIGFGLFVPYIAPFGRSLGASDTVNGLLVGTFSLFQFVCAQAWGRLSDRIGRRPVLLIGLLGSSLAHLAFGFAASLPLLFVARALAGGFGATISTAQAYIADVTTPETRTKGMGLIGAAFGLGFVLGPALGFFLLELGPRSPAYFASLLSFAACAFGFFKLKEPARNTDPSLRRVVDRRSLAVVFADKPRVRLLFGFVFVVLSFAALESMFTRLGQERLHLEMREMNGLFAIVGILMVIVQGGLIRRLAPKYGEVTLVRAGSLLLVAGMLTLAFATPPWLLIGGGMLAGVGYSVMFPALQGRLSKATPAAEQGATFGVAQSGSSLCRFIGHSGAGLAFDVWTGLPFVLAASIALCAGLLGSGARAAGESRGERA